MKSGVRAEPALVGRRLADPSGPYVVVTVTSRRRDVRTRRPLRWSYVLSEESSLACAARWRAMGFQVALCAQEAIS